MDKFTIEMDRFVKHYYQKHDEEKAKSEKFIRQTEIDLEKLAKQSRGFERELEARLEKMDKWLGRKQQQLENNF